MCFNRKFSDTFQLNSTYTTNFQQSRIFYDMKTTNKSPLQTAILFAASTAPRAQHTQSQRRNLKLQKTTTLFLLNHAPRRRRHTQQIKRIPKSPLYVAHISSAQHTERFVFLFPLIRGFISLALVVVVRRS